MRSVLAGIAAFLTLAASSVPARAGDFEVAPLSVHLRPGASSQTISVTNSSAEPLRIQVNGLEWQQNADGKERLTPTDELVFFPTLLEVAPHSARAVRVGIANPRSSSIERTYRLFVLELPSLASQLSPQTASVAMRMQFGIPVFLDPVHPVAKPAVSIAPRQHGKLAVHLMNNGNAHFQASSIEIHGSDQRGTRVLNETLQGWYVLANGERVYDVPVDNQLCSDLRNVQVTAFTDAGTVTRTFPLTGTDCR